MLGKIEGRRRGDDREWDGWMASLTQGTWVWASSRRWWWTGKPRTLQSMGWQRAWHDWTTEQQKQRKLGNSKLHTGLQANFTPGGNVILIILNRGQTWSVLLRKTLFLSIKAVCNANMLENIAQNKWHQTFDLRGWWNCGHLSKQELSDNSQTRDSLPHVCII